MVGEIDASGNVYVTGSTGVDPLEYEADLVTIKYDTDGNELWVARYDNNGGVAGDSAGALALDDSGNVYVTGSSDGGSTELDYATVKYDGDGNQVWVARHNGFGNGDDTANSLAVDASGSVYVTGRVFMNSIPPPLYMEFYNYCTVKYLADGTMDWSIRHDNSIASDHVATSVAVDVSGNVYVTGRSSLSPGAGYDYGTIKYVQEPEPPPWGAAVTVHANAGTGDSSRGFLVFNYVLFLVVPAFLLLRRRGRKPTEPNRACF